MNSAGICAVGIYEFIKNLEEKLFVSKNLIYRKKFNTIQETQYFLFIISKNIITKRKEGQL
ncbi:hypothetical protein [Leptospira kirschneri]|uniref:hypothetical protein n=1 Tax=Leptospira kirschneri TaxID=29507 RepID=UPI0002E4B19B|nr:hypothetical protein [Leptospira kirschneri]KON77084.1 Uncharacterized protein NV38_0002245 [Leptospira kirschneri serovar Mozdok]KPZ76541.1 hypothetical protein APS47_14940 [Leptospira kirschneri serovar Mozdok]NDK06528.1 hypothetical protein [Leptospira kirschneri serovar Mozdok]OOV49214.1 hypothetical protein B1J94_07225 [Leptospira kirschneri serovar Grippotyphosa]